MSSIVRWLCSEYWGVGCENGCVCESVLRCCDMHLLACDMRGVCVALRCVVWWLCSEDWSVGCEIGCV